MGRRGCSMQSVCLSSSGLPFPDAQKQMTFTNLADLLFYIGAATDSATTQFFDWV